MRRWNGRTGLVICALVAGIVALPAPAAAWVAFAKVTTATGTIDGDSTAKGYEKQIVVLGLGNRMELPVLEFFYTKLQWTDLITGATGSTP